MGVFAQENKVVCKSQSSSDQENIMVTVCTYKNMIVEQTDYFFGWCGGTSSFKYYLVNGSSNAEVKLGELFNDQSSKLLTGLNITFKAQLDSLKQDEALTSCFEDSMEYASFSFDQIKMQIYDDGVVEYFVNISDLFSCSVCDRLLVKIPLTELDKYLK